VGKFPGGTVPKLQLFTMMAAALTACAPANSPKVPAQSASFVAGRVLLLRPVNPTATEGLLQAAMFEQAGGPRQDAPVEFIVRTDDGATLSIVQDNGLGLRAGDRVVILRGDHARLARPG
jgi:hypothetical protein